MEHPVDPVGAQSHSHNFLGEGHEANERKTWAVIVLCGLMMLVEIVGGSLFGSLALIADGLHMSTHAGAMLIAALAYTYARRHATDDRFVFGTGKLGDLAGFTSAIVLAVIACLIGYEALQRFLDPVAIAFNEAIPIAVVGLLVNVVSAWLLSGGDHHRHSHGGGHSHDYSASHSHSHGYSGSYREADAEVRAPFRADTHRHAAQDHAHDSSDPGHGAAQATLRDNSIRSAYVHVLADAFVSVLAITGLILAKVYGWVWMDPLAGIIGALVIANWSITLIRDTAGILLDICPDEATREGVRRTIEMDGDHVVDLHLWRLGPGHLAAVLAISTSHPRDASFYRGRLSSFACLSHITVEVTRAAGS
jgi:cation diffusion facilitator family transporter